MGDGLGNVSTDFNKDVEDEGRGEEASVTTGNSSGINEPYGEARRWGCDDEDCGGGMCGAGETG